MRLSRVFVEMGKAGIRMQQIGACEASAGNISVFIGKGNLEEDVWFSLRQDFALPCQMPDLAGGFFVVTGSGTRLPDIADNPDGNLGLVKISDDGASAVLCTSPGRLFSRLTCEFNSHLAVHRDRICRTGGDYCAVVHAQPVYLTFLSFIRKYQDEAELNRRLFGWQAECLVQIPDGIGYIPFHTAGSEQLVDDNIQKMSKHVIVLWAKHGVMSRSDQSVMNACDYIEYLETSAKYEFMNIQIGRLGEGLLPDEIDLVCSTFGVHNSYV